MTAALAVTAAVALLAIVVLVVTARRAGTRLDGERARADRLEAQVQALEEAASASAAVSDPAAARAREARPGSRSVRLVAPNRRPPSLPRPTRSSRSRPRLRPRPTVRVLPALRPRPHRVADQAAPAASARRKPHWPPKRPPPPARPSPPKSPLPPPPAPRPPRPSPPNSLPPPTRPLPAEEPAPAGTAPPATSLLTEGAGANSHGGVAAEPLWELERLRLEREWADIVGASTPLPVPWDGSVHSVVAVELDIIREVIGTPSRIEPATTSAAAEPAAAVATARLATEILRRLAKAGEEIAVSFETDTDVTMAVAVVGDEVKPDLSDLTTTAAELGGRLTFVETETGFEAQLQVPSPPS